jgi:hypothetical protein
MLEMLNPRPSLYSHIPMQRAVILDTCRIVRKSVVERIIMSLFSETRTILRTGYNCREVTKVYDDDDDNNNNNNNG